jgi:hemin uptake protein HemP
LAVSGGKMSNPEKPVELPQPNDSSREEPVVDVSRWFGDHREIVLELEGVRYRLRITRRNRLILQK